MKHLVSVLLYIIVILLYLIVRNYEPIFIWLAWCAGYWKDSFEINK